MTTHVIVDAGPLVAFLNARDEHHAWAKARLAEIRPPLITCDAVLAKACYLLRDARSGPTALFSMIKRAVLVATFRIAEQAESLGKLMTRYENGRMDLADACLVRMSELSEDAVVMTLDSDFHIYRRHGRQRIPTIAPG